MKLKIDPKYKQIAVLACIVIVISGFLLMSVNAFPNIQEMIGMINEAAAPIIWGIVIAYLVNPAVELFRTKVFKKWSEKKKNSKRTQTVIKNLSITIAMLLALALLVGLIALIVPQFIQSISDLISNFNTYSDNFLIWSKNTFIDFPQITEILEDPLTQIQSYLSSSWSDISKTVFEYGSKIGGGIIGFLLGFKDFIIGFIIAIYLLSSKNMLKAQAKKTLFALLPNNKVQSLLSISTKINDIFSHYITGIIIDACFVGCVTFIGAAIIGAPYPVLMAIIIACTNVIPFFGPFLGGIPVCFITLLADPMKAVWMAIFMVAMQQFDGNIMVPLIQGDRIGVPSVWILIGIIIGGGLFGFAGMLLAVPIFAIIYMLVKAFLETKLKNKSMPENSLIYTQNTDKYTNEYVYTDEERQTDEKYIESTTEKPKKTSKQKTRKEQIMKLLMVAGVFDDNGGRKSSLADKLYDNICKNLEESKIATVFTYKINGGNFDIIKDIASEHPENELHDLKTYDTVFWLADIPNEKEKLRDVKTINPRIMLVNSKRNDNNKYTFGDLIQRSLAVKANLTIEFSKNPDNIYNMRVFDPLGVVYADTTDIGTAVSKLMDRLMFVRAMSRQTTIKSDIPKSEIVDEYKKNSDNKENVFTDIVRKYATEFQKFMPEVHTERFVGNASLRPMSDSRCAKGMPSFRTKNAIFVSKRNIDKQFITFDNFVPVYLDDNDKLYYCGDDKPSVDTPIQVRLYRALPNINFMLHSHCYLTGASFTARPIPCGAIEEFSEIIKFIDEYYPSRYEKFYKINLIGHGSVVMANNLNDFNTADLKYEPRPYPEKIS